MGGHSGVLRTKNSGQLGAGELTRHIETGASRPGEGLRVRAHVLAAAKRPIWLGHGVRPGLGMAQNEAFTPLGLVGGPGGLALEGPGAPLSSLRCEAWVACHYERRLKRPDYLPGSSEPRPWALQLLRNADVKGTCGYIMEHMASIPLRCLGLAGGLW